MTYQAQLLFEYIIRYKKENDGVAPSYQEMVDGCGLTTKSRVREYLDELVALNKIELLPGPRGIMVVGGVWDYVLGQGVNKRPFVSAVVEAKDGESILNIVARGMSIEGRGSCVATRMSFLTVSDDELSGWRVIEFGLPGEFVTQLCQGQRGIETLFAGTSMGNIYESSDHGETWVLVETGLLDNCLMLFVSSLTGAIYASSDVKAIRSLDGGISWEDISVDFGGVWDYAPEPGDD